MGGQKQEASKGVLDSPSILEVGLGGDALFDGDYCDWSGKDCK